jgi:hypothetical protein
MRGAVRLYQMENPANKPTSVGSIINHAKSAVGYPDLMFTMRPSKNRGTATVSSDKTR